VTRALRLCLCGLLLAWTVTAAEAAEAVRRLFFEAIPATQIDLPHLDRAGYADRERVAQAVVRELLPELFRAVEVDPAVIRMELAPGGYLGHTNPSIQAALAASEDVATRLAAALGLMLRQESVLVAVLETPGDTFYALLHIEGPRLTPETAQSFFVRAAAADPGLGGGYSTLDGALLFLNMRDSAQRPYSGLGDDLFGGALGRVAAAFVGARIERAGSAAARFIGNDWAAAPAGEQYRAMLASAGKPDRAATLDALQRRHTDLVLSAADRGGWR
jgi:hypothetical protein